MKKTLCILLILAALICPACAENTAAPTLEVIVDAATEAPAERTAQPTAQPTPETVKLSFEDGFSLELPEDWQYYKLTADMAAQGVLYCLSDAEAARWLYIQRWNTDCADTASLKALIDRAAEPQTSGIYTFNDTDFVIYDLTEGDVSCCAVLLDGRVLNFVFTPQSDAAFMATATQIISSFSIS